MAKRLFGASIGASVSKLYSAVGVTEKTFTESSKRGRARCPTGANALEPNYERRSTALTLL